MDHILDLYYDVEDQLAARNSQLFACQSSVQEAQLALAEWRNEILLTATFDPTDGDDGGQTATRQDPSSEPSSNADGKPSTADTAEELTIRSGITAGHDVKESVREQQHSTDLRRKHRFISAVLHRRQRRPASCASRRRSDESRVTVNDSVDGQENAAPNDGLSSGMDRRGFVARTRPTRAYTELQLVKARSPVRPARDEYVKAGDGRVMSSCDASRFSQCDVTAGCGVETEMPVKAFTEEPVARVTDTINVLRLC